MMAKVWLLLALFATLGCFLAESCDTPEDERHNKYYAHSDYEGQMDDWPTSQQQRQSPVGRSWGPERNDTDSSVYWMIHDIEGKIMEKCEQCMSSTSIQVISFRKHRDYKGESYLAKVKLNYASDRYRVLHLKLREERGETRLLSFIEAEEHTPIEPWKEEKKDGGDDDEDDEDDIIDSILDLFF